MKDKGTAYLLWLGGLIGLCGLHRFYTGHIFTGLLWLFTLGLLGIGQLIDLFLIPGHVDMANLRYGLQNGALAQRPVNVMAQNPTQTVIINSPPPIQPPPASVNANSEFRPYENIERLGGLMERGLITREEFDASKAKLLGQDRSPGPPMPP